MSPKPKLVDSHGGRDAMMDKLLGLGVVASEDVESAVAIPEAVPEGRPEAPAPAAPDEDDEVHSGDGEPGTDVAGAEVSTSGLGAKGYASDPRLRPAPAQPAASNRKIQIANRIPFPLKDRLDRHQARTGETITSLLERMLEIGLEIAEADAGVDADGKPVQR